MKTYGPNELAAIGVLYFRRVSLVAAAMRTHHDAAMCRHALQLDAHAQPARSRDSAGGVLAAGGVHPAHPGRLLAAPQVLPVRRVRADVYRTSR